MNRRPIVLAISIIAGFHTLAMAQAPGQASDAPVVYCRDPVRQIVTRVLASDCRAGEIVSEKEAEAARNASSERRRRVLLGDRPDDAKPDATTMQDAEPPLAAPPKADPVQAKPVPRPKAKPPITNAPVPNAQPAAEGSAGSPVTTAPSIVEDAAPEPVAPPPALAEIVAIVASMKPGEFRAVSKNTMESVKPNLQCGGTGIFAVMNAWGGAAFDRKRHRLMITGGGHADYCGNEVYAFDLATLAWMRETEPSKVEKDAALTAANPNMPHGYWKVIDGSEAPLSFHSYDGLQYLPNVDRMFALPQASWMSGWSYDSYAYLYDPAARRWKRGAKAPASGADMGCDYWPKTGEAVCTTAVGVIAYDPTKDTWRTLQNGENAAYGKTAALDPERNLLVQIGRKNPYNDGVAPLVYFNLNRNTPQREIPTMAGNTEFIVMSAGSGIAWHPPTRRFVIWPGGNEIWAIDRNWNSVRYSSPTGPAFPTWYFPGVYGKWQYVPSLDAFIGVRSTREPVWIYKLPKPSELVGDTSSGGSVNLQAIVDGAQAGGTARLPAGRFRQALVVSKPVTIEGNGTNLSYVSAQGKGSVVISADKVTVKTLTVTDIGGGNNLAAIRLQAPSIVIDGLRTERVQTALLSAADGGTVIMRNAVLLDTLGAPGDYGHTHAIYVGCLYDWNLNKYKACHERHETINTVIRRVDAGGHTFKSRAMSGLIERSVLAQEGHDGSRSIDLSNGGDWTIRCSVIQHGSGGNSDIIGFGREGDIGDGRKHRLVIDSSVIINDRKEGAQLAMRSIAIPVVRNSVIIGVQLADAQDGGGNKLFTSREASGLPPYPAAELSMLPASCR